MTYDDYSSLSPDLQKLYNEAHEAAVWSNDPVEVTFSRHLAKADVPAQDKAAVMDAWMPGAGAVFLR